MPRLTRCWICLLALLLLGTLSAEASPDPGGWGRLKWGMTDVQVRLLYPQVMTAPPTPLYAVAQQWACPPIQAQLVIPGIPLLGTEFDALLYFKDNQLWFVALRPQPSSNTRDLRLRLLEELEGKYGKASSAQTGLDNLNAVWWWPKTSIWLHYQQQYKDITVVVSYAGQLPPRSTPTPTIKRNNPNL